MIALVDAIKGAGMKPKLWIAPLAAHPRSELLRDHADMLLLDRDGKTQESDRVGQPVPVPRLCADGAMEQGTRSQSHG